MDAIKWKFGAMHLRLILRRVNTKIHKKMGDVRNDIESDFIFSEGRESGKLPPGGGRIIYLTAIPEPVDGVTGK